jgi:hypothetical protein
VKYNYPVIELFFATSKKEEKQKSRTNQIKTKNKTNKLNKNSINLHNRFLPIQERAVHLLA